MQTSCSLVKWQVMLLLALIPFLTFGQFVDDFSDPNLEDDVTWQGDLSNFAVEAGRLQLQAPDAGTSTLSTNYIWDDSLRMGIDVYLQFAPSADNALRIYFFHENSDPGTGQAIYMDIGESGGNDAFTLFTRDEVNIETEINRFESIPHSSTLAVGVRLAYITGDQWRVGFDHGVNGSIDQNVDLNFTFSPSGVGFFGIKCDYTATRTDKFFFDNVFVEKIIPDRVPPVLQQAMAASPTKIILQFDESIDGMDLMANQFSTTPPSGISEVQWSSLQPQLICLELSSELLNETQYTISASGIIDDFGNVAATNVATFTTFFTEDVSVGDVIINEIHFTPSTTTLVPNTEFVELYNRSTKLIDLSDLDFEDAASIVQLPFYILFPNQYVVITDLEDLDLFSPTDSVVGVSGFPSLNNDGDIISLSREGDIIDEIIYRRSYLEDLNKNSGWSLELKNPNSACKGAINWSASIHPSGGTPGRANSIASSEEPTGVASISAVRIIDEQTIGVVFSLEMNRELLLQETNYQISPTLQIQELSVDGSDEQEVLVVSFDEPMQEGVIYTVLLSTNLCFCNGMKWEDPQSVMFGLPQQPERGDIRISEILFSPFSGQSEFIEIVNTSDRIIRSTDLWLFYTNNSSSFIQRRIDIDFLIFPNEYHVFSDNPSSIIDTYEVPFPNQLHASDLPSLTNAGGLLSLFVFDQNLDSVFIDDAIYSESFHDPLLDESNGISLERLDLTGDGRSRDNWFSASTLQGGATPTGENSQHIVLPEFQSNNFELTSPTFSPDGDGFEDAMVLAYNLEEPGFIAQVNIFAYDGSHIKTLVNNESLASTGQLIWSGETDDGSMARIGIYYVLIKAFQTEGKTIEEKKKIVLAKQL